MELGKTYRSVRGPNTYFTPECMLSNGDWAGIRTSELSGWSETIIVVPNYFNNWEPIPEKKYIAIYKTKADITKMDWCYGPVDYENFQKWKKAVEKDYTIIHEFEYEVKE